MFSFLAAYGAPFGTHGFSFNRRLFYWSLVVVISSLMASCCARVGQRLSQRFWVVDGTVVVLMSLFFTPVLMGLNLWLLPKGAPSVAVFLHLLQFVALISLGVVVTRRVLPPLVLGSDRRVSFGLAPLSLPAQLELPEPDPVEECLPVTREEGLSAPVPEPARLLRRLPEDFPGPILRLSAEDHFVEVASASGCERLRMRLADAIDEMDTVEGQSVHRSHWVARDAIDGVEREGARIFLRLSNGDRVPVSRTYKPKLEEAGIL
ncbi:hypothetical protein GCM10010961_09900 [Pseudodonghicola xiamenensis]|uniref:HTH LytTR-type domain-containing protein n=1 Tax=Pseudodonghicola xiamenensis TaxID=337702 RepID=A0A8J3H634_9RHOB|nr:hypothetical protein GCM10010961_09900 [Pseudodonghicola xiamenensis]